MPVVVAPVLRDLAVVRDFVNKEERAVDYKEALVLEPAAVLGPAQSHPAGGRMGRPAPRSLPPREGGK